MPSDHSTPLAHGEGAGERDAQLRGPDAGGPRDDRGLRLGDGLGAEIDRASELPGLRGHLQRLTEQVWNLPPGVAQGDLGHPLVAQGTFLWAADIQQERATLLQALGQGEAADTALRMAGKSLAVAVKIVDVEPHRLHVPHLVAEAHGRLGLFDLAAGHLEDADGHLATSGALFDRARRGLLDDPPGQESRPMASDEHFAEHLDGRTWHYRLRAAELLAAQGHPEQAKERLLQPLRPGLGEALPPPGDQHPAVRQALLAISLETDGELLPSVTEDVAEGIAKEFHSLERDNDASATWLLAFGHAMEKKGATTTTMQRLERATTFAEASSDPYVLGLTGWAKAAVALGTDAGRRSPEENQALRRDLLTALGQLDQARSPAAAKLASELRNPHPALPDLGLDAFSPVEHYPLPLPRASGRNMS